MFRNLSLGGKILIQATLAVLGLCYLIPLGNVVWQSLGGAGWQNYTYLFNSGFPIVRMIFNSVIVSALQIIVIIAVASPAAFAFSKLRFPGSNVIYIGILLTMSISMLCFITPLFQTLKTLGWMNTYVALVLPAATFWLPVAILILRNYFDSLGRELLEATMMEGGGFFTAWFKVYLPISRPATINVVVFAFINSWNDYLNPLLFSRTDDMKTLPMAVVTLTNSIYGARPEVVAACLVIMAVPSVAVYLFLQDFLGDGMTAGSVKG
jgi:ABC-type glycerol-3-phosphate transport system permease component